MVKSRLLLITKCSLSTPLTAQLSWPYTGIISLDSKTGTLKEENLMSKIFFKKRVGESIKMSTRQTSLCPLSKI
jgi:hypothetical protein